MTADTARAETAALIAECETDGHVLRRPARTPRERKPAKETASARAARLAPLLVRAHGRFSWIDPESGERKLSELEYDGWTCPATGYEQNGRLYHVCPALKLCTCDNGTARRPYGQEPTCAHYRAALLRETAAPAPEPEPEAPLTRTARCPRCGDPSMDATTVLCAMCWWDTYMEGEGTPPPPPSE